MFNSEELDFTRCSTPKSQKIHLVEGGICFKGDV